MSKSETAIDYLKRFVPNKKDTVSSRIKKASRRILIALDSLTDSTIIISENVADTIYEHIENYPIMKHAGAFENDYKVSKFLPDYLESVIDHIASQSSSDDFSTLLEKATAIISLIGGMVANKDMEIFYFGRKEGVIEYSGELKAWLTLLGIYIETTFPLDELRPYEFTEDPEKIKHEKRKRKEEEKRKIDALLNRKIHQFKKLTPKNSKYRPEKIILGKPSFEETYSKNMIRRVSISSKENFFFLDTGHYLELWNLETLKKSKTILKGKLTDSKFSYDGNLIVASYFKSVIKVYDSRTGKIIQTWKDPPKSPGEYLLCTADIIDQGQTALVNWYRHPTKLFDIESGDFILEFDTPPKMDKNVAVSPQGNFFIIYNKNPFGKYFPSLWNSKTKKELGKFETSGNYFSKATFSADEEYLAAGNREGEVTLWSVRNQKEIQLITKLPTMIRNIAFSPDSLKVYVTSEENLIRAFSIKLNKEIGRIEGHESQIWGLSISKSGRYLLSGGDDNIAVLWKFME